MGTGSLPGGGKELPGRDADPSLTSSAVGHERVELYLYSPYEPYGLYRASVPVQGYTLPLPLHQIDVTHRFQIVYSLDQNMLPRELEVFLEPFICILRNPVKLTQWFSTSKTKCQWHSVEIVRLTFPGSSTL